MPDADQDGGLLSGTVPPDPADVLARVRWGDPHQPQPGAQGLEEGGGPQLVMAAPRKTRTKLLPSPPSSRAGDGCNARTPPLCSAEQWPLPSRAQGGAVTNSPEGQGEATALGQEPPASPLAPASPGQAVAKFHREREGGGRGLWPKNSECGGGGGLGLLRQGLRAADLRTPQQPASSKPLCRPPHLMAGRQGAPTLVPRHCGLLLWAGQDALQLQGLPLDHVMGGSLNPHRGSDVQG